MFVIFDAQNRGPRHGPLDKRVKTNDTLNLADLTWRPRQDFGSVHCHNKHISNYVAEGFLVLKSTNFEQILYCIVIIFVGNCYVMKVCNVSVITW